MHDRLRFRVYVGMAQPCDGDPERYFATPAADVMKALEIILYSLATT